jgi:hypothetical protein
MNAVQIRRQHEVTQTPARAAALHTLSQLRGRLDLLEARIASGEPTLTLLAAEVELLGQRLDRQVAKVVDDETKFVVPA